MRCNTCGILLSVGSAISDYRIVIDECDMSIVFCNQCWNWMQDIQNEVKFDMIIEFMEGV